MMNVFKGTQDLGGSGGISPQEIFTKRGSEITSEDIESNMCVHLGTTQREQNGTSIQNRTQL